MNLDDLDYQTLKQIHDKYVELGSLTKTCDWLAETHNIETNRFKLSKTFKVNRLNVKPPNGQTVKHWRDTTQFSSHYGELAAAVLQSIWDDIFDYKNRGQGLIHFASACTVIGSDFYAAIMGTLAQGVMGTMDTHALPPGITPAEIAKGRQIYEDGYRYWVLNEH